MILVKKYSGGKTSFRTQRGMVHGRVVSGFVVVDVDPIKAKMMRVLYKFHPAPLGFKLEQPKKEEPKKVASKPAAKKTSSKKKASSKKK